MQARKPSTLLQQPGQRMAQQAQQAQQWSRQSRLVAQQRVRRQ